MTDNRIRRSLEAAVVLIFAALTWAGLHAIAPMFETSHESVVVGAALATSVPMIGIMLVAWAASQR